MGKLHRNHLKMGFPAIRIYSPPDPAASNRNRRLRALHAKTFPRWGIVKSANQVGFLPDGLTPSVDGNPRVSRIWATEDFPRS